MISLSQTLPNSVRWRHSKLAFVRMKSIMRLFKESLLATFAPVVGRSWVQFQAWDSGSDLGFPAMVLPGNGPK